MTAAATLPARGFSNLKDRIYYPLKVGKSAPGQPLTAAQDISDRARDVTSGGRWTNSPDAIQSYELYNAISSISMQNAVTRANPAVTVSQIADLLAESAARGLGLTPELSHLYDDGLITKDGLGGVLITGVPVRQQRRGEKQYLGWHRGKVAGLKYLSRGHLQVLVQQLHSRLVADGLPAGVGFPDDVTERFERGRERREVALPWWAWEALVNLALPAGRHPVTGRTVANRVAELVEAGKLVQTRLPRTRLHAGSWVTAPGAFAAPRPGLRGVTQRVRARFRAMLTPEQKAGQPSEAWKELAERWRFRDAESGWGPW